MCFGREAAAENSVPPSRSFQSTGQNSVQKKNFREGMAPSTGVAKENLLKNLELALQTQMVKAVVLKIFYLEERQMIVTGFYGENSLIRNT